MLQAFYDSLPEQRVQFFSAQLERAPTTGQLHWQGYVEFEYRKSFNTVKALLPLAHWEYRRGNRDQAKAYVTKEDTRVEGIDRLEYGEHIEAHQGKRSDIDAFIADVNAGMDAADLFINHGHCMMSYQRGYEALMMEIRREFAIKQHEALVAGTDSKTIIAMFGDTECGKTRFIHDTFDVRDVYKLSFGTGTSMSLWFDDYRGEKVLLIDDFYGQIMVSFMLRLLDRYILRVQVKGRHTYPCFRYIFITSNVAPDQWYRNIPHAVYEALLRRLNYIFDLPSEIMALQALVFNLD